MIYKNVEFSAIVTKRKNYRERDMLVTMFTDKYGFKTFFVRGVRKRGFKLGAAILPFTHGTYIGSIKISIKINKTLLLNINNSFI